MKKLKTEKGSLFGFACDEGVCALTSFITDTFKSIGKSLNGPTEALMAHVSSFSLTICV